MATGSLDTNGIWKYGEDDSEATFSALLNKLASSTSTRVGIKTAYRLSQTVYFTGSGTFSKASYPWLKAVKVRLVGGGAGGASAGSNNTGSGGGGGGGYAEKFITDITGLASSVTVTVGAGGNGGGSGFNIGSNGGTTSFGSLVVATGGTGGRGHWEAFASGGSGGIGTAGDLLIGGQGGGGATIGFGKGGFGGSSQLGGGGAEVVRTDAFEANGNAGRNYGGGGSGGGDKSASGTGGNGANGVVIVELYA